MMMQNPKHYLLLLSVVHALIISFYVVPLVDATAAEVSDLHVGIILDLDTTLGRMIKTCVLMALEDIFEAGTRDYTFRIVPHIRNSSSDTVAAASAAIDLLKNAQVQAIFGPQKSIQAEFVINLGSKVKVPIVSPATSPSLSPRESPYFVRAGYSSSFQAKAIADIVKAFGWTEVVFVYEDNDYGSGILPSLSDAMQQIYTRVTYRSAISPSASDDQILKQLYKLMTMQTRVFVVHLLPSLARRLFLKAKEAGMMKEGFAWLITDSLTSLLDSFSVNQIELMQGVVGLKHYVPRSHKLENFTRRWRKRFREENPDTDRFELNVYGLWAYDTVQALVTAVDRVGAALPQLKKLPATRSNFSDLDTIGTSEMGPRLVESIRNLRIDGLSGDFHIVDGQLQPSAFQVVNIIGKGERGIGFWTAKGGIMKELNGSDRESTDRANPQNLRPIIWPGQTTTVPKGWEIPTGEKKLRVGVPVKNGLREFTTVKRDPKTHAVIATGFCIEVFKEVIKSLPYAVPYEFIPFEIRPGGESAGDYNELVYQIFLKKYDAVVGDVTILESRSRFVDFTLPFTESGVAIIVPLKDERKNAWIFMKPLTMDLWLTTGAFFIFTGFVVWVLEHRINDEFRGPMGKQVGTIFWFSFSTLVFAHKEKIISNLSRFVLIVWMFVVLVLTSSFTANLTSMLTVQQLRPIVSDISDLIRNSEYVGYQKGSFVDHLLESKKFDSTKFRNYSTFEEYDEALSKGSRNGGVSAIVDELPYLRLFLAKYCRKYTMLGTIHKTAGFGFAFPKGSPLVPDVSRAVLNVTEGDIMRKISKEWFGEETSCPEQDGTIVTSDSLTMDSFMGLFLIAGLSSSSALMIYLFIFFQENKEILSSDGSIMQKLTMMTKIFDEKKKKLAKESTNHIGTEAAAVASAGTAEFIHSAVTSAFHQPEGIFSRDEGFSSTEPANPIHDAILISDTC